MIKNHTDASDGSVQEIAVNSNNPLTAESESSAATASAANDNGTTTYQGSSGSVPTPASPLLTDKQEASAAPVKIQTGMVAVALLRPYARNTEIYQEREDALFTENIRKNGVLTDLVVTEDGEILGGNRRLLEAQRHGLAGGARQGGRVQNGG